MNYEERKRELLAEGYEGFVSVKQLMSDCSLIPNGKGIYYVLRKDASTPVFLEKGCGGTHKGKNPNVPIEELKKEWIDGEAVVYIGKTDDSLSRRIGTYLKFGRGEKAAHWGGRYIWQLKDAYDLVFCWKVLPNDSNAENVEKDLLERFREEKGCRPFANLRG